LSHWLKPAQKRFAYFLANAKVGRRRHSQTKEAQLRNTFPPSSAV